MIKKIFLNLKCKKLAGKKPFRAHSTYVNSTKIGILFNRDEFAWKLVKNLIIKELIADDKVISYMIFQQNKLGDQNVYHKKDITIFGRLMKNSLHSFVKQPFDFLIVLDTSEDIHVKYILALSGAICKIGIYAKGYSDLLMMTLKPAKRPEESMKEMIRYLKMI